MTCRVNIVRKIRLATAQVSAFGLGQAICPLHTRNHAPFAPPALYVFQRDNNTREKYRSRICPSLSVCSVHLVIRRCRWHSSKTHKASGLVFHCRDRVLPSAAQMAPRPKNSHLPALPAPWLAGPTGTYGSNVSWRHIKLGNAGLWVSVGACDAVLHPSHKRPGELEASRREVGTYAQMRLGGRRRKLCVQFQGAAACFPWGTCPA